MGSTLDLIVDLRDNHFLVLSLILPTDLLAKTIDTTAAAVNATEKIAFRQEHLVYTVSGAG